VDFLLVLILLGVTAEALPAKRDWKSAFCQGRRGEVRQILS